MNALKCFSRLSDGFLQAPTFECLAKRSAVVLRRKFPLRLHKLNQPAKRFRSKDFVYELVKDDFYEKKENINVVLTSYVEGLGKPGEQVSVRPFGGYERFILPGLAVYATPENLEKYGRLHDDANVAIHSSKYSFKLLKLLAYRVIGVSVNDSHPWTLEPWHLRVAFRMNGFIVPESAIEMPGRAITGPKKEQQRKEFYVTVTISETEKVKVRCRIHLVGINSDPVPISDWIEPSDPLFEDDREVLDAMPKVQNLPYISKLRVYYSR